MVIGGLEKISLIDFPGNIATVVFTKSCNFRCHFCYNPMLVLPIDGGESKYKENHPLISEDDFFLFLESRAGKVNGVVISGGEPTLQADLKEFIVKIKKLGFNVKLDTNGTRPEIIEDLISEKLIDYVAMDFKAPLAKYEKVVSVKVDLSAIKKSVQLLLENKVPYEFRTTLVPGLHELEDIYQMAEELTGAEKWFLQKFKSNTDLVNNEFKNQDSFSSSEIEKIVVELKKKMPGCDLRE
ncbi:MAG: anaerobic ribonucleoside-triphosphate reductase activating protein [Actinomycetota bacterium]|nr:anaerobic ribonucleoside-triphosphate reductase activating protein [Actinomycetota bacterium]